MKDIAPDAFADCHAQIHIQSYPGDAHAGVMLVRRSEIRVIMMMVVAVMRMSRMASRLDFGCRHGDGER